MARYIGPKCKLSRREGTDLQLKSGVAAFDKKCKSETAPGQHGARRGRLSDYGVQLREKQKVRRIYGVLEKQFSRYYKSAARIKGNTGENLLTLLETRLDNVCFRLGFGNSRQAARQLVGHGHVLVNGRKLDVPSYHCKPGDKIKVGPKPSSQQLGLRMMDLTQAVPLKEWVALDRETMEGSVARLPEVEDIDPLVNVQLIVELYSR